MKRALVLAGLMVLAAGSASAMPPQGSRPPATVSIVGVPEVGKVLSPAASVPSGAICQWMRNGSAISGATSCISYTVQAADIGTTITLQVTTAGRSAFAALTISGTPAPTGTVGTAYSFTPTINGGSGSNTCALSPSVPGLGVAACVLSGTPTTAGTYSGLNFTVTDSVGGSASLPANPFTITVASSGGGGNPSFDFSQASNSQNVAVVF